MFRFFILGLVAVSMLGLVIYSQFRQEPDFVSGTIEAEEIRLGSRLGGRVHSVLIQEGDSVLPEQPIIELEPFDLIEKEKQAIEQLKEAEAILAEMESGLRTEEVMQAKLHYDEALAQQEIIIDGPRPEEIAAAENRLKAAVAELDLAQLDRDRADELYQQKSISKAEFDRADKRLLAAQANENVRKNELAILNAGARKQEIEMAKAKASSFQLQWELAKKGNRREQIERARAARNAAAAAVEVIRQQKKELIIRAPRAGIVDSLNLYRGDLVAPNSPVTTVISLDNVWIRTYIPQKNLNFEVGHRLRVTFDNFPKEDFYASIASISSKAEFIPRNVQTASDRADQVFRVRMILQEPPPQLRPGMTVNVWLNE